MIFYSQNMVVMPETLMSYVLYYIHYIPEHWVGRAHTQLVRSEFGQLFQHKIVRKIWTVILN